MKTTYYGVSLLVYSAALSLTPCLPVVAAGVAARVANTANTSNVLGSIERGEAKDAGALLARAVDYLQKNGSKQAFSAFNDRNGTFINGPYYVYVVGVDGIMYANGGAPDVLVGKNVLDLRDAAKKPLIRELLNAAASHESGAIEYRWLNRVDNKIENKTSLFRKVGSHVVAVGYYLPRATAEQAQDLLSKAVAKMNTAGVTEAFAAFNDPKGDFIHDDLYVFVIGLEDGKYRASGAAPQQTGQDTRKLHDAAGKPLFQNMIALAKKKGSGKVDYVWRNPATNAVESKHSLIQRVDDVLVGVGYYAK
ncbi:hypothetical protein BH11PSE12_BH11PSE12_23540 [soil metagenome]